MGFKLLTQLVLIITALVVIFAFIKPSFEEIRMTQDDVLQYSDAVNKAAEFNARLQELVNVERSFSQQQMQALETFIPSEIDEGAVMRDIQTIFRQEGVELDSLVAKAAVSPTQGVQFEQAEVPQDSQLSYQDFTVGFTASYDELRSVLQLLERNAYLFEVVTLDFTSVSDVTATAVGAVGSSDYTYKLTLRTFAYVTNL